MDSDDYREMRERSQARRSSQKHKSTDEIIAAIQSGIQIKKITEYHYKLLDKYDVYPVSRKIMDPITKRYKVWKNGKFMCLALNIMKNGGLENDLHELIYLPFGSKTPQKITSYVPYAVAYAAKRKCLSSGQYNNGVLKIEKKL